MKDVVCDEFSLVESQSLGLHQFFHTQTQLTISAHLLYISDNQVGPLCGIIIMFRLISLFAS